MSKLTFDQRLLLFLYKVFYGEEYPIAHSSDEAALIHMNTQNMCYMLHLVGIDIGDFRYSWNSGGPYSPGLRLLLRSLDSLEEEVKDFYSEKLEYSSFFTENDIKVVKNLLNHLKLKEHPENLGNWMELLGTISYLSNNVLPGEGFDLVNSELVAREDIFKDENEKLDAWNTLLGFNLVRA